MNLTARIDWHAALGRWSKVRERMPLMVRRAWRQCARRELQAAAVCAAGVVLYFGAIRPERARLDTALREVAALEVKHPAHTVHHTVGATPLDQFYARFPTQTALPDALEQLLKTAAVHALTINDGEYTVTRVTAGRLVRFQILLPLRGTYPQLRGFLAALPHEVPGMAVENARFERSAIGDPTLDVKLRLVLFLAGIP